MQLKKIFYSLIPPRFKFHLLRFWFLLNHPFLLWQKKENTETTQTLLIISLPRSGSSWVGDMLGSADNARYLREPITRTFQQKTALTESVFELDACPKKRLYKALIKQAFSGIPRFTTSVIANGAQWLRKDTDKNKIRVIKEVNPLILNEVLEQYQPKVIYLVRHPAAVLNSYFIQGWRKGDYNRVFSQKNKANLSKKYNLQQENFWQRGATYHFIMQKLALTSLQDYSNKLVITYEDICLNPEERFAEMFQFSGLNFTTHIQNKIKKSTSAKSTYQAGTYDLNRDSQAMLTAWKNKISTDDLQSLKKQYLDYQPTFYQDEKWW